MGNSIDRSPRRFNKNLKETKTKKDNMWGTYRLKDLFESKFK